MHKKHALSAEGNHATVRTTGIFREVVKMKTFRPKSAPIFAKYGFQAIFGIVIGALALSGMEAQAAPFTTYGFGGASGVFAASCSGPANGGLPNGNIVDNRIFFPNAATDCTANPLTPSANSNFASGNVTASGTTTTSTSPLGSISGAATMSTAAQNSVLFPAGFTDAGWIDTMLVSNGPNNGLVAQASVMLNVTGTLSVSGPNVVALLQLAVSSEVAGNPALHQPSYQIQAPAPMLVVNDMLTLDIPFIIGTPSQFLVRAMARAMTSSQTSFGNNTSDVNFLTTVTWGGIEKITVGGNEVTTPWTAVGTVSGINWAEPFSVSIPEPPSWTLFALPFLLMLFRTARRPGIVAT